MFDQEDELDLARADDDGMVIREIETQVEVRQEEEEIEERSEYREIRFVHREHQTPIKPLFVEQK